MWSPAWRAGRNTPISSTTSLDCLRGRCLGCGLFLGIAYGWSGNAALKYALPVIALVQLLSSGWLARSLGSDAAGTTSPAVSFAGHILEA